MEHQTVHEASILHSTYEESNHVDSIELNQYRLLPTKFSQENEKTFQLYDRHSLNETKEPTSSTIDDDTFHSMENTKSNEWKYGEIHSGEDEENELEYENEEDEDVSIQDEIYLGEPDEMNLSQAPRPCIDIGIRTNGKLSGKRSKSEFVNDDSPFAEKKKVNIDIQNHDESNEFEKNVELVASELARESHLDDFVKLSFNYPKPLSSSFMEGSIRSNLSASPPQSGLFSRSPEYSMNAALWPRQPNQFAFSQEDEIDTSESDEVYSEELDLEEESKNQFHHDDEDDTSDTLFSIDYDSNYDKPYEFDLHHHEKGPLIRRKESIEERIRQKSNIFTEMESLNFNEKPPQYHTIQLNIIYEPKRTGFEPTKELEGKSGEMLGNRYKILENVGEAAFSYAYKCLDVDTLQQVCCKVIKNNKEYFDQGLDEIKVLQYIRSSGNPDQFHVLRLFDYFYFKEHLIIVTELLNANLYEHSKNTLLSKTPETYFNIPRLKKVAFECLKALNYIHSIGLIHCDLKPENVLMNSYDDCTIKVIDFGSSCFITDEMNTYIQSRSYRAPEVILGLDFDTRIDIWSLGCIIAELYTGDVLFSNDSVQSILLSMMEILGPLPSRMLYHGSDVNKYFTEDKTLFEVQSNGEIFYMNPIKSSLSEYMGTSNKDFIDFLSKMLELDPLNRPSAEALMHHPWLQYDIYKS